MKAALQMLHSVQSSLELLSNVVKISELLYVSAIVVKIAELLHVSTRVAGTQIEIYLQAHLTT